MPIYLLVLDIGYAEAWHHLTPEQQQNLWAQVEEVDRRAGARWVIRCDSRWADEATLGWAVLEYPDMDSYQLKVRELEKLNWWCYFSAKSILGTQSAG